jgi:hypothetical protein
MTDEQANDITKEQAIRILHPDTRVEAIDDYEEAGNYEHAYDMAILMAIAALREPARKPCGWCNDGVMQIVDSPNKPPIRSNYCGLCGRKLRDCHENCAECGKEVDDD